MSVLISQLIIAANDVLVNRPEIVQVYRNGKAFFCFNHAITIDDARQMIPSRFRNGRLEHVLVFLVTTTWQQAWLQGMLLDSSIRTTIETAVGEYNANRNDSEPEYDKMPTNQLKVQFWENTGM